MVKVSIKINATVRLYVQIDKNLGAAGELPPITLSFYPDAAIDMDAGVLEAPDPKNEKGVPVLNI